MDVTFSFWGQHLLASTRHVRCCCSCSFCSSSCFFSQCRLSVCFIVKVLFFIFFMYNFTYPRFQSRNNSILTPNTCQLIIAQQKHMSTVRNCLLFVFTLKTTAVPAPDIARTPTASNACDQWNLLLKLGAVTGCSCRDWVGACGWILEVGCDGTPWFTTAGWVVETPGDSSCHLQFYNVRNEGKWKRKWIIKEK